LAVISGFSNLNVPDAALNAELGNTEAIETIEAPLTTQEKVEQYFSDLPIMVDVARCESHYIHLNKDGTIRRGRANSYDVGVMQINEQYHLKTSKRLGYDIYSLEGNMAYARYLYEKEGARPWMASSPCWAKYSEIARK
jgi:hypothetical protein